MRLLKTSTIVLEDFTTRDIPPYAILSHTWTGDEVTYQDLAHFAVPTSKKASLQKIHGACKVAAEAGHSYIWIDSCCIDKSSSSELSEAINSMFQWYANAEVCYTYLFDYKSANNIANLSAARWFTRGWTLQELIAPQHVEFYDTGWSRFGTRHTLRKDLARITGIERATLASVKDRDIKSILDNTTIAKRMCWAAKRRTTKKEDAAYCLLGIFNINMPLIYGEGANAFIRLQKEIMKQSNDLTLFAWQAPFHEEPQPLEGGDQHPPPTRYRGILAFDPIEFSKAADLVPRYNTSINPDFSMTNKGLRINTALRRTNDDYVFMPLNCSAAHDETSSLGIYLRHQGGSQYLRVHPELLPAEGNGAVMEEKNILLSEKTELVNQQRHRNAFVFEFDFDDQPVKFLSAHPQELWDADRHMFITSGTPDFAGYLRFSCDVYVMQSRKRTLANQEFLVACALSNKQQPWMSLGQANGPLAGKPIDGRYYNLYDAAVQGFLLTFARNGLDSIERLLSMRIASTSGSHFVMYKFEGFDINLDGAPASWQGEPVHTIRVVAYESPKEVSGRYIAFIVSFVAFGIIIMCILAVAATLNVWK